MHWSLPLFLLLWSQGASSNATGRGMDEGPWSSMMMDPQPEVLIVKDKGSPAPAPAKDSGMGMKDLLPLLCLLAPLLLAAIMIPAKMSMMMNMMNGGGTMMMMPGAMLPGAMLPGGMLPGGMLPGGMLPGGMLPGGMFPGGMLPGGMLPGGMFPGGGMFPPFLKMLLMSGGDGGSPTQLPVTFKAGSMSKEFGSEFKMANSSVASGGNDTADSFFSEGNGGGETQQEGCKSKLCRELKKLAKKKKKKGDEEEGEMSRVWSKRTNGQESIAQQIIGLVDHIERVLSGEESD